MVGAGIIGAATAYHLARLGARVTVVDANREPRGASYATFGWINANGKEPDHYFELNRAGMEAHRTLAAQLDDASWLHWGGSLEWAYEDGMPALHARVVDHAARGYPAAIIDSTGLQELEPGLHPDPMPSEIAYFPTEGWADSVLLIDLLLEAAQKTGTTVIRRVRATRVNGGARPSVIAESGDKVAADVIVNCAGSEASLLLAGVGLDIKTAGPPGLNVVTAATSNAPSRVIRSPDVHFRPETAGRVMIGSTTSNKGLAEGADPHELAVRNLETAARHMPGLGGLEVEEARVARRAVPPDGLPLVGRLPDSPWLYHVVTHSGVTLAPLLGRLVAEEIVNDTDHAQLASYRPARFVSAVA